MQAKRLLSFRAISTRIVIPASDFGSLLRLCTSEGCYQHNVADDLSTRAPWAGQPQMLDPGTAMPHISTGRAKIWHRICTSRSQPSTAMPHLSTGSTTARR
eukprot:3765073-Rhodomonas_salina.6